jgi:hypothetical protein
MTAPISFESKTLRARRGPSPSTTFTTQIGEGEIEIIKEHSAIEEKAYRDSWGMGLQSYLSMLHERLNLIAQLLAPSAHIYVHLDYRLSHYARVLLDEHFGIDAYRNESSFQIVGSKWGSIARVLGGKRSPSRL